MNKKFLIAAMALPMLFTACSQEELFEGVNTMDAPQAKGLYVTLAPTLGEGVGSRAQWDGSKLTWENTDKISMYWLNAATPGTEALYGNYNSVFKTEDGEAFTSESMVFVGGNIAVYPGNTKFVKPGTIELNVPTSQDENTIEQTPYISNYLSVADPDQYPLDKQVAGYNNGLYSPMKMAANVLVLNLELANTEKLIANYGFKIDSVSLVSKTAAFASTANLLAAGDAKDQGVIKYGKDNKLEYQSIVSAVKVKAEAKYTALTTKHIEGEDGNYQVKFVVLPTDAKAFDEDAEIVIYTNCGRINLTTTKTIGDKTTNISAFPTKEDKEAVYAGVVTGAKNEKGEAVDQTIAELLTQITTSQVGSKDTKFEGEFIGKKATRTVKADMSDATLNNSKVFNSENILKYVAIHTAMNSKEQMNLILSTTATDGIFKTLTKEAIAAVDAKNTYNDKDASKEVYKVKLSLGNVEEIEIVGGGAVYNAGKSLKDEAALILADAEWTMNDNASWANVSEVINNGTLTIAGTATKNVQNVLAEKVKNNGTLKIAGNGELHVGANLFNNTLVDAKGNVIGNGVIEIAANQFLVFNETVTEGINGIINVKEDGFLTLAKDIEVTSNATINNNGLISAEAGKGGLTNTGIINVLSDGAITYVQANENIINLKSRDNEVKVNGAKGKIVYNYNSATDGSTFKRVAADKFTYVVFGEGNSEITLAKDDTAKGILPTKDISMEFTAGTTLTTAGREIDNLKVSGHLKVLSNNTLYVTGDVVNEGIITVGGYIEHKGDYSGAGKTYTVGEGAIVKK